MAINTKTTNFILRFNRLLLRGCTRGRLDLLEEGSDRREGTAYPSAGGRRRPPRVRSRSVEQPTGNVATEWAGKNAGGAAGSRLSKKFHSRPTDAPHPTLRQPRHSHAPSACHAEALAEAGPEARISIVATVQHADRIRPGSGAEGQELNSPARRPPQTGTWPCPKQQPGVLLARAIVILASADRYEQ